MYLTIFQLVTLLFIEVTLHMNKGRLVFAKWEHKARACSTISGHPVRLQFMFDNCIHTVVMNGKNK